MVKGEMQPSSVTGMREHRTGGEGDDADEEGSPGHDLVERGGMGGAVGPTPAEEVACRQVEQDQPDDGCPHQVGGAEVGAEQAGGGQFDGQ
jgi:hypothetical protein